MPAAAWRWDAGQTVTVSGLPRRWIAGAPASPGDLVVGKPTSRRCRSGPGGRGGFWPKTSGRVGDAEFAMAHEASVRNRIGFATALRVVNRASMTAGYINVDAKGKQGGAARSTPFPPAEALKLTGNQYRRAIDLTHDAPVSGRGLDLPTSRHDGITGYFEPRASRLLAVRAGRPRSQYGFRLGGPGKAGCESTNDPGAGTVLHRHER